MIFWYIFVKIYCGFIFKRILLCCKSGKFLVFYKKHFEKICNFILFIFQIFKLFVISISLEQQVTTHSKSEFLLSKTANSLKEEFLYNPWELSNYVSSFKLTNITELSKFANSSCCAFFVPKLKVKTNILFEDVIKKDNLGNNIIEYEDRYFIQCTWCYDYYSPSILGWAWKYFPMDDFDYIFISVGKKDFSGFDYYSVENIGLINLLNGDSYIDRDKLSYWQSYMPTVSIQAERFIAKNNNIDKVYLHNGERDYVIDCVEISWADLKKSDVKECIIVVASFKKEFIKDEVKILQKVAFVKVVHINKDKVVEVCVDYKVLNYWKNNKLKITDQAFNILNTKKEFQIWWEENKLFVEKVQKLN